MPMPQEYQLAADRFDAFLADAGDALDLATRNQTYTAVQAVLLTFRRRLTAQEVLVFANGLPAVLRAIFVADWQADAHRPTFGTRVALEEEVRSLRRNHNFVPQGAIATVAAVVRRHADPEAFDKALSHLSPDAQRFWEG